MKLVRAETLPILRPSEAPRQAVHGLSISLARNRDVVEFARRIVHGCRARDRVSRIAALFTFVGHLVAPPPPRDDYRDGVDVLMALAGEEEGAAVILAALLMALGERATVDYVPGMAFVRVELEARDLPRLPPHAEPFMAAGRCYLPLDARTPRGPMGWLPPPRRTGVSRGAS